MAVSAAGLALAAAGGPFPFDDVDDADGLTYSITGYSAASGIPDRELKATTASVSDIENYADARAKTDLVVGEKYHIKSRAVFEDGGHGDFYAVNDTRADNDGTYLQTATTGVALKRIYTGSKHLSWFGGDAGYVNGGVKGEDNLPAILAAIDADRDLYAPIATNEYGGSVYINPGRRYVSDTIELKTQITLHGDKPVTAGHALINALYFEAGKTGINVNSAKTLGDGLDATVTSGGDTSVIKDLGIYCVNGGVSSGDLPLGGSGINLRARANISGVTVNGFPLDGIRVSATAVGASPDDDGNANSFAIEDCRLLNNRRAGLYVNGPDANAGNVKNVDCSANGQFGIYDSSFLGNTYVGCHTASNGAQLSSHGFTSVVHHQGKRYCAHHGNADESLFVTTTPGTNENIWRFIENGGVTAAFQNWDNTVAVGTYKIGGAYINDNANAYTVFSGCYSESGQSPSWISFPAVVLNGIHSAQIFGDAVQNIGRSISSHRVIPNREVSDNGSNRYLSFMESENLFIRALLDGSNRWLGVLEEFVPWGMFRLASWKGLGNGSNILLKTDVDLPIRCGRPAAMVPGSVILGPELYIGNSNAARRVSYDQNVPINGIFAKGDLIFNNRLLPANNNIFAWQCITESSADGTTTPAVWKTIFHSNPTTTTAARPTGMDAGFTTFDTTLNQPIWFNGTGWVDSTGATV